MKYVIAVLALNAALAAAHALCCLFVRKAGARAILEGAFIFMCPIVAPVFYGIYLLSYKLIFSRGKLKSYIGYDKNAEKALSVPDLDRDLNIVPLEEAMLVSNTADLRRMMLNLIKTGGDSVIGAVSLALESEDGETAHYSASAVADSLAGFQKRGAELAGQIEKDGDNARLLCEYIEFLTDYLKCGLISGKETGIYVDRAADSLNKLISLDKTQVSDVYFRNLSMLCIVADEMDKAESISELAWEICPDTLGAYYARMNVMFAKRDYAGFKKCLDKLKKSGVPIDQETLELIRALG